jgi:hypothetical protein
MFKNIYKKIFKEDIYFYFILIFIGMILRITWLSDMEWKFDQAWMFFNGQEIAKTFNFPLVGMKSGGGILNPALGIWLFSLISMIFKSPITVNFMVAFLNIVTLAIMLIFGLKSFQKDSTEQSLLIKACALASVSPLAILYSRNIWAQDLIPFFSMFFFVSVYYRSKKSGAFFWGLVGSLLGQIHMPGFFYAFGFLLIVLIYDIKNKTNTTKWGYWILGSFIGSLALVPWLIHLSELPTIVTPVDKNNSGTLEIKHIVKFRFYIYMLLESLGIHLKYTLKTKFWEYIKMPFGTYLVGIIHIVLLTIGMTAFIKWIRKTKSSIWKFKSLSPINILILASWIGGGGVLTIIGLKMHPHYIICAFPFSYYFMVICLKELKPIWTKIFISSQLLVSIFFMSYIHSHDGIPDTIPGDYGKTYKAQLRDGDFDLTDSQKYLNH